MNVHERIKAFHALGNKIRSLDAHERKGLFLDASNHNPWFIQDNLQLAWEGILKFLDEPVLTPWVTSYRFGESEPKTIGVVMAGNIPLVGFHDYLCVLLSGNTLKAKLSSQDAVLLPQLHKMLVQVEPRFEHRALFSDRLDAIDAVIATGSDNTSRYFEYYFRTIPRIIRKNRTSIAVLTGEETIEELSALAKDVFLYFGLGCRNVAKLYVPEGYDFKLLFESWQYQEGIVNHHKYANNYDYQKSIMLVNLTPFLDNGFVMLKEDAQLVSPISVIFHESYSDESDVLSKIELNKNKIQCIVSGLPAISNRIAFGQAQFPEVNDYADGMDTMTFLSELES